MNINKNKSIRKGFVFSKTIFPAAGALLLATQMTGCTWIDNKLGNNSDDIKNLQNTNNSQGNGTNDGIKAVSEAHILYPNEIMKYLSDSKNSGNIKNVKSSTEKYVISIPQLPGGGKLIFERDENGIETKKPALDKNTGKQKRGFEFQNPTDDCWEYVKGDGQGVIIVNLPTKEQSNKLDNMRKEKDWIILKTMYRNETDPEPAIKILNDTVLYIKEIGNKDFYPTTTTYVQENLIKKKY